MKEDVKMLLKGKPSGNGLKIYDFEKEIDPRGSSDPAHGAIYMYMTIIVKQIYWYVCLRSQVSVYRTDHWSSGYFFFIGNKMTLKRVPMMRITAK